MKKIKKAFIPVLSVALLTPTFAQTIHAEESMSQVNTPAIELRGTLDHLLSEHFALAVLSMQKQYDGDEGAQAAQEALEQNAADMKPAIASLYGDEGAEEFDRIFSAHNDYTAEYVQAVKDEDTAAQEEASAMLDSFYVEFGEFLETATEGTLPSDAAIEVLDVHEQQVEDAFIAYVEGDYETAYMTYREGLSHMFDISAALSDAIVQQNPDQFEGSVPLTAAGDLRSDVSNLVAEHFALATLSMSKEFKESEDFDFVSWAEDENTADLKATISSVYGEEGGEQFEQIWQGNHILAQSDYVNAVKNDDEAAKEEAQNRLGTFADEFGMFLETATDGILPAADATELVNMHEEQVFTTFDRYIEGDYDGSFEKYREGYAFTFDIGAGLADAIVTQNPELFEEEAAVPEMPQTGMGGTSDSGMTLQWLAWILAGATAGFVGYFGVRRFRTNG
ncbi:copper amine oxidase [Bacillaceae bacterium JMAK1]|nr:copper amine oxidase [Bacillaceae bacterium JMAK1]